MTYNRLSDLRVQGKISSTVQGIAKGDAVILDENGQIPASVLPDLSLDNIYTKDQVDSLIGASESKSLTFKGYISTNEPPLSADLRGGEIWYIPSQPSDQPDPTFPWTVYTYSSGSWSASTSSFTPSYFDVFSDINNDVDYYYLGDEFKPLNYNNGMNPLQFTQAGIQWSISKGSIDDSLISPSAAIQQSKIDGLVEAINDLKKYIDERLATSLPIIQEMTTADYYMCISKYPDGWMSAYGEFQNAGIEGGLHIELPAGFVFIDNRYGLSAGNVDSDNGADESISDDVIFGAPTTTGFNVITKHITNGLVAEYTQEKFSFNMTGRWK